MLIPLKEWAEKNNIDASTARHKIRNGNLNAIKLGRDWFIQDTEQNLDMRLKKNKKIKLPYYIDFGVGYGNLYANTLEEAMDLADRNATFTQKGISIFENGTEIMHRKWIDKEYNSTEIINPLCFGLDGYYDDWNDLR